MKIGLFFKLYNKCLYSTIKATFLHNNFNSKDSANIRRNVSLQIALIAFLVYTKKSQKFRTNVFCWSVDQLTFRHKFDCVVYSLYPNYDSAI